MLSTRDNVQGPHYQSRLLPWIDHEPTERVEVVLQVKVKNKIECIVLAIKSMCWNWPPQACDRDHVCHLKCVTCVSFPLPAQCDIFFGEVNRNLWFTLCISYTFIHFYIMFPPTPFLSSLRFYAWNSQQPNAQKPPGSCFLSSILSRLFIYQPF